MDAGSWDERYAAAELVWSATPNQIFAAEVEPLPVGTALDLGTGEGRNAIWLAERGWSVTAVDFSSVGVEKARALAERRDVQVNWLVEDLVTYVPPPGSFDLVALVYIHLPALERRLILERAAAAVAPGGSLLVIGHDSTNLIDGTGGPQNPDLLFTAEDIVAEIGDLHVVRAERVWRHVTGSGDAAVAIDAIVRVVRENSIPPVA